MNVDEAKARVEKIRAIARDDERAHSEEDELRHDILNAIANGSAEDPKALAAVALTTSDIQFARWCA